MADRQPAHWSALAALILPYRGRYGALVGLVTIHAGTILVGPLILRRVIDRVPAGASTAELTGLAASYLAAAIAAQTLGLAVSWRATSLAWRAANDLRLRLAGHALGLGHDFHRRHGPGELIQRVDGDVSAVSDFLSRALIRAFSGLVLAAGTVVAVGIVDWRLGLGMAAYAGLAATVIATQRHRSVSESADELKSSARLYGGIEDRLTASEDLRANGGGDWAVWRFVGDTIAHVGVVRARERASLSLWRRVQGVTVGGTIVILVLGALGVSRGVVGVGTAFLLFQYSLQLRRPLEDLTHELSVIQKASGAMDRIGRLLATSPAIADGGDTSPPSGPLSIRFRHVDFDYGDGRPVLADIDLTIEAGRSVGLVGHTGSGKTTLSRLLLRLVEATAGAVELGGVPVDRIPLDELRRRVLLVPQTVDLLTGSVRDNVTLFDDDVSDVEVDRALAKVGLGRFRGEAMHEPLAPGGAGLSAGEAQLLALARAWLSPCDLVVLDEPTARVDPVTEAALERAISSLFDERSVVVIAHRLSTLHRVDEIVVLERGRVTEHGDRAVLGRSVASRYRELLEASGDASTGVAAS